jgi:aspartate racemase
VIFGCTEIGMLLDAPSSPLPVSGTTLIHVETALTWVLPECES